MTENITPGEITDSPARIKVDCGDYHQWQAAEPPAKSSTAGMNLGDRIAHVCGRVTPQGLVEFGSVMAVSDLIGHALRDIPTSFGPHTPPAP